MENKIIEILKTVATHAITSELNPDELDNEGFKIFATRIDSLYSESMSEDEVDRAYMRWYFGSDDYVIPNPNEPINNTFYAQLNTWRNCVEWYKPHPTPEISEDFKDKIKTLIGYLKIWNRSGRMCFPPPELNGVIEEADVWIKELNDK